MLTEILHGISHAFVLNQNTIPSDATADVRAQRILVIVTRSGIKVCVQLKVKVGRTWE